MSGEGSLFVVGGGGTTYLLSDQSNTSDFHDSSVALGSLFVSFGALKFRDSSTLLGSQTEMAVGINTSTFGSQGSCSFFSFPHCDDGSWFCGDVFGQKCAFVRVSSYV